MHCIETGGDVLNAIVEPRASLWVAEKALLSPSMKALVMRRPQRARMCSMWVSMILGALCMAANVVSGASQATPGTGRHQSETL